MTHDIYLKEINANLIIALAALENLDVEKGMDRVRKSLTILKDYRSGALITDREMTLLREAISSTGSYEPREVLPYFEERLYAGQYEILEGFLNWIVENDYGIGSGNAWSRFEFYRNQV